MNWPVHVQVVILPHRAKPGRRTWEGTFNLDVLIGCHVHVVLDLPIVPHPTLILSVSTVDERVTELSSNFCRRPVLPHLQLRLAIAAESKASAVVYTRHT